jgi:RNase H-like domain found in reverse transcriptase/Reverse transcriptase (RNA-dependent DNA polymerase)/Integrase zinc binding domain/PHD-finger
MDQGAYEVEWSGPLSGAVAEMLCSTALHGAPVQDFLQHAPVDSVSYVSVHPACDVEHICGSFCHYPMWQEVYELAHQAPQVQVGSAVTGQEGAAGQVTGPGPSALTPEMVRIKLQGDGSSPLSDVQMQQLQSLCMQYADVFSVGDEVGMVPPDLVEPFRIEIKEGVEPKHQRSYRFSRHEEDWLKGHVAGLESSGIVRRATQCDWVSPAVVVHNAGKYRMCGNYRCLNAGTKPDTHPMPRVEDVVNAMVGSKWFCHLDVRHGFWHLPIAEEDCHKTAFATPFGVYEFTRMPFGLVNAPAAYQRCMDAALSGVERARPYMDDTFVFDAEWEGMLATLEQVFIAFRRYNIKLNWDKCNFGVRRVKCLGYIVSEEGVMVDAAKVEAITRLPAPRNASDVKSFLGMAGFFRHFISGFAELSLPLVWLTKRHVPFVWTAECQQAFEALKQALVSAPCLRLPDWDRQFILHVDWSKQAVGAYLSQRDDEGREYPVHFASRLLTPAEQRYAPLEGECLALVWATHKFRYYLHGRRFQVFTDHKSLEWLQQTRFENAKVERWALRLQEFQFDIAHVAGEKNVVADCLSRFCALQLRGVSWDVVCMASHWPAFVQQQADYDAVACAVCGDPGGHDNMVICGSCDQCYHLRCCFPPMSTVPSEEWLCPACDPLFRNKELFSANTPLKYAAGDPHCRSELVAYLQAGCDAIALPADAAQARAVKHAAAGVKLHPRFEGWLMVRRRLAKSGATWLCCPPVEYRWDIMRVFHDALGHCGERQLLACLHNYYHWRGISSDVSLLVRTCDACQRRKLALPELPPLQQPVIRAGPFRHVHIDLAGPFPTPVFTVQGQILPRPKQPAEQHKAWVVLMVDYFTKAAEFYPVFGKSAMLVAEAFYCGWVCRYGVPEFVTSDNGGEFAGVFGHMLERLGVEQINTSACHPAANGAVERLVKSFKDIMVKLVNDHPEHWLKMLPQVRLAYTSRLHLAIGVSPFEMLHGCRPRLAHERQAGVVEAEQDVPDDPEQYVAYMERVMQGLDKRALSNIRKQFNNNARAWQQRRTSHIRRHANNLAVGDFVLELDESLDSALNQPGRGPYRIVKLVKDGAVAVLETGATDLEPHKRVRFHRHISVLARYIPPPA